MPNYDNYGVKNSYRRDVVPNATSNLNWYGMYRAKVVEVDIDENDYAAVRVFIPDLFVSEFMYPDDFDEDTDGLIAYPANNIMGSYNTSDLDGDSFYQACISVPRKNSWVWIFFEGGDTSRAFYTAGFMCRNSKVPPENRDVEDPHKVFTLKSGSGRAIIICDSEDQQRVEITGKKRTLSGGPSGEGSVYEIDGNMTTILIDERDGSEKILIRSHKGDFLNFDVEERKLMAEFESDIIFKTKGKFQIDADQGILMNSSAGPATIKSQQDASIKSTSNVNINSDGSEINVRAGSNVYIDGGALVLVQNGVAAPAPDPNIDDPSGDRG